MNTQPRPSSLAWLWLAALVIVLDQLSKLFIVRHLGPLQSQRVLPVFNLTYWHNTGAAFSFLDNASGWQRWLFTLLALAVSIALVCWLRRIDRRAPWLAAAITLVLGGALGNAIDRLRLGYVIDFIQVHWGAHYFPIFNVADSAITIGAALLIVDTWLEGRRQGVTSS
jgi:signal peptidase II